MSAYWMYPQGLFYIRWHNQVQSSHKSNIKNTSCVCTRGSLSMSSYVKYMVTGGRRWIVAGAGVFVKFSLFFSWSYAELGSGVAHCLVLDWELGSHFWQAELISFSFDFFRHTIAETISVLSNYMSLIWKKMVSIHFCVSWISSRIIHTCVWCVRM